MSTTCLNCQRVFPAKIDGEVEPGGLMLCRGCGHVMAWTDDLSLRELTESERIDASGNRELMVERMKIGPRRGIVHRGSWMVTCLMTLIIVMVVLERLHVIPMLHHK
jgi:hypothetical protein